jgi:hypothetical protein
VKRKPPFPLSQFHMHALFLRTHTAPCTSPHLQRGFEGTFLSFHKHTITTVTCIKGTGVNVAFHVGYPVETWREEGKESRRVSRRSTCQCTDKENGEKAAPTRWTTIYLPTGCTETLASTVSCSAAFLACKHSESTLCVLVSHQFAVWRNHLQVGGEV